MINNSALSQANSTINIESLSSKQLVGECLDITTKFYKELINNFCEVNGMEYPFTNQKTDFSLLANYITDPSRLDQIIQQYAKNRERAVKSFIKSWFFQMKSLRNFWAHSEEIPRRLAIRGFDTLALLYQILTNNLNTQMFEKIQFFRKILTVNEAKTYI